MKNQKGNTALIVILVVAGAALLLGFLVMRQRIKSPSSEQQTTSDSTQNQATVPEQTTDQTTQVPAVTIIPADWKVYANDKYVFNLQYPPALKAGAVSGNSVLGTFQVPVKGFHVGSLVLVALKDAELKKQANDYFNASYDLALHPQTSGGDPGIPPPACAADKINNPDASVLSVSCTGEGGPARYAYIKGSSYDVFIDGYSQGFDNQNNGKLVSGDYEKILSSFKFGPAATAATPSASNPIPAPTPAPTPNPSPSPTSNPNPAPAPAPAPTPPPTVIKTFSIDADDNGATPAEISVAAGTIVEITFKVSATNVYYGGLDFRSSVVNSGTIQPGGSKTISFTAKQPFSFTPYWPASNVAKAYTIKVSVQ